MPSALVDSDEHAERYNWFYHTEPEPGLERPAHAYAARQGAGRLLVDQWPGLHPRQRRTTSSAGRRRARAGWGYRDVLPYFRRAESRAEGGDEYRGVDGPLGTRYGTLANPLHAAWLAAAQAGRLPADRRRQRLPAGGLRADGHDGRPAACAASAANAYLRPACAVAAISPSRPARWRRAILFEGRRAVGVRYRQGGDERTVRARREVLVCPAARSTRRSYSSCRESGPRPSCANSGSRSCTTCPESARTCRITWSSISRSRARSRSRSIRRSSPLAQLAIGVRWVLFKTDSARPTTSRPAASSAAAPASSIPDIQYHFLPMAVGYDGNSLAKEHGFQAHVGPMRSKSRGWVRLASKDPADKPRILFNYMSHPDDWVEMRAACASRARSSRSPPSIDIAAREISAGRRRPIGRADRRLPPRRRSRAR